MRFFASEVCGTARKKDAERFWSRHAEFFLRPGGRTGFGSITLGASRVGKGAKRRAHVSNNVNNLVSRQRGLRFAQPTLQKNKNKAGGTPADANSTSAPYGCGSAPAGAARLPAFHRGSCGSEPTPPFGSRRASWDAAERRWLAAPACPSPAIDSQAGHNAGRAFSRSRPSAEVTSPCPRAPLSLHQPE
jgi:hypothetical protein